MTVSKFKMGELVSFVDEQLYLLPEYGLTNRNRVSTYSVTYGGTQGYFLNQINYFGRRIYLVVKQVNRSVYEREIILLDEEGDLLCLNENSKYDRHLSNVKEIEELTVEDRTFSVFWHSSLRVVS